MPISLVAAVLPSTIRIARLKGLVAKVRSRSSHEQPTPTIGGMPIMVGICFTVFFITPTDMWANTHYILAALLVAFLVGVRDDMEELSPRIKLGGQLLAIVILIGRSDIRLESMYGLLTFHGPFPYLLSAIITAFTLLVISNAFNLIDGINGLAGTVGTIIAGTFGIWFFMVGDMQMSILSLAVAGSLLGFLMFNMQPARTFMGDSGSLVVGLALGVLAIRFIDTAATAEMMPQYRFMSPVAVCVGIMVVPLFDTIRVFTTRLLLRRSPFKPDRRHIHHLVVDSGFSHLEGSTIIAVFNLFMVSLVFWLDGVLGLHWILAVIIGITIGLTYFLNRYAKQVRREKLLQTTQAEQVRL